MPSTSSPAAAPSRTPCSSAAPSAAREKERANTRSKTRRSSSDLASVAASASRNGAARSQSTSPSAANASLSSDVPTATPSLRSASANPISRRSSGKPDAHPLGDRVEIRAVLDDDRHRRPEQLRVDVLGAEQQQRACPVDRVGDRRRLLAAQPTHHRDDLDQALGDLLRQARGVQADDLQLPLGGRVVEPQVQATAL